MSIDRLVIDGEPVIPFSVEGKMATYKIPLTEKISFELKVEEGSTVSFSKERWTKHIEEQYEDPDNITTYATVSGNSSLKDCVIVGENNYVVDSHLDNCRLFDAQISGVKGLDDKWNDRPLKGWRIDFSTLDKCSLTGEGFIQSSNLERVSLFVTNPYGGLCVDIDNCDIKQSAIRAVGNLELEGCQFVGVGITTQEECQIVDQKMFEVELNAPSLDIADIWGFFSLNLGFNEVYFCEVGEDDFRYILKGSEFSFGGKNEKYSMGSFIKAIEVGYNHGRHSKSLSDIVNYLTTTYKSRLSVIEKIREITRHE